MKTITFFILFTFILLFAGCTDDKHEIVNPPYSNTPVVAYTQDAFAYSLVSSRYSSNSKYDVSFTSDSLAYSLVISGYRNGGGYLRVETSDSIEIFSETLQSNKVVSFTQIDEGIPAKVIINSNDFTGTITFSLAKMNKR